MISNLKRPLQTTLKRTSASLLNKNTARTISIARKPSHVEKKSRDDSCYPIGDDLVLFPVRFVPQNSVALHQRFGKFIGTCGPGLKFAIPFIDTFVHVRLSENVYAVTTQQVITKDNASVSADGVVYYQVIDPEKAAFQIDNMLEAILNLAMTNLRSVMGDMTLDELLSGRKKINESLLKVMKPATEPWGVVVTRIEIKNIAPDTKLVSAMDQQMTAEREKRAEVLKAEASKNSRILDAEGLKSSAILEAEGRLEVAKRDAEAIRVLAEAEANSLKVVAEIIEKNPAVANFTIAKETATAWSRLASSSSTNKVIFLPSGDKSIVTPIAMAAEMLGDLRKNSAS